MWTWQYVVSQDVFQVRLRAAADGVEKNAICVVAQSQDEPHVPASNVVFGLDSRCYL